jgi:hypothetical protein
MGNDDIDRNLNTSFPGTPEIKEKKHDESTVVLVGRKVGNGVGYADVKTPPRLRIFTFHCGRTTIKRWRQLLSLRSCTFYPRNLAAFHTVQRETAHATCAFQH